MAERNYVAEMRQLIDQEATGEYVSGVIAVEIVEKLRATDPDLLIGWLADQAANLIREAINTRDRSRRTYARIAGPRSVFRQAAEEHDAGEPAKLRGLLDAHYVVNGENLRKPLGSMLADDLRYVSSDYADRAKDMKMESAFFAALARKVGKGKVEDVFTEDQVREMRDSIRR